MSESAVNGIRKLSSLLLVIVLISWFWFQSSMNTLDHIESLLFSIAFLLGVIYSKEMYKKNIRYFALGVYVSAIVAGILVLYEAIFNQYGPDFGGILTRAVFLYVLWRLVKQALVGNEKTA